MAKKRREYRGGTLFLISFLSALVLFGSIMTVVLIDQWQPAAPATPTTPTTTRRPSAAREARRLLLITEENGEAQGFVALSIEPATERVRVVPIPRETVVTVGTEQLRLFEWYRTADLTALTAATGELIGWDLPHYAVLSYHNLAALVTHLNNGVVYTLTESITYTNSAGATVTMAPGARTLSAAQVTDLLRYDAWHGGRRARANAQGDIIAALFNQYFTSSHLEEDTDFQKFVSLSRSNLLTSDFATAQEDLLLLARRNTFDISKVKEPKGEFIGVGDAMRFEMAENPLS